MGKNKRRKAKGKAPGANSKDGPLIFEDNSLSTLEQNQPREYSGDAESQQTGVSESDLDLDKPVVDDDKQYELEKKVKSLQEDVHQCLRKEAWLDVRLEQLQNEIKTWMFKEVQLNKRIKALEDDKNTWALKQSSNEEMMCKLDGTNAELQIKVYELGESRDQFSQENQQLMNNISLMELRVQKLEETIITESLAGKYKEPSPEDNNAIKKIESSPELVVRNIEDPQEENTSYKEQNQRSTISENHIIVEFESSKETGDVALSDEVSASYSSNVLEAISIDGSFNEASAIVLPASADQSGSREVLLLQFDEIEIQKVDSRPAVESEKKDTVPLTDAPLIAAPFRLISFMAKYVSGADLVKENARTSRT